MPNVVGRLHVQYRIKNKVARVNRTGAPFVVVMPQDGDGLGVTRLGNNVNSAAPPFHPHVPTTVVFAPSFAKQQGGTTPGMTWKISVFGGIVSAGIGKVPDKTTIAAEGNVMENGG